MPAPRVSQAPCPCAGSSSIHHIPRPIRNTASHSAVVNQVDLTAEFLASRDQVRSGSSSPRRRTSTNPVRSVRAAPRRQRGLRGSPRLPTPAPAPCLVPQRRRPVRLEGLVGEMLRRRDRPGRARRETGRPLARRGAASSARGTTRLTRPSRSASAAGSSSPKKKSSFARWGPIEARQQVARRPRPGAMPRRTNTSMKVASSAASTRSQASARCIPPPAAVALTAAMTGFSQSRTAAIKRCQPVRIRRAASPTGRSGAPSGRGGPGSCDRRSAPVQKPFSPAPVTTTARTARSADASSSHSTI